jgi:sialic acid synthase SpsE
MSPELHIRGRHVGLEHPTYFIADIAANHDGSLDRAKELIVLAAQAGADAAKFQNFTADTIVSDRGFRDLGSQVSHQAAWKKSVYEVYDDASLALDWTAELRAACDAAGIDYFTSPYSLELVDHVDPFVDVFKVGSGDITWLELLAHIATKRKPVILATGASSAEDVDRAMHVLQGGGVPVALLQCNTNYTGSLDNLSHVNLRVLNTFAAAYPDVVLGLSDHTPGQATVLGAVAFGARVIEKHFTDNTEREGPDHGFSMTPTTWRDMVDRTRELEAALGDGVKRVEANEVEPAVLQRRAVRAARALPAGHRIAPDDVVPLRPCPPGAISAADLAAAIGKETTRAIDEQEALSWADLQ